MYSGYENNIWNGFIFGRSGIAIVGSEVIYLILVVKDRLLLLPIQTSSWESFVPFQLFPQLPVLCCKIWSFIRKIWWRAELWVCCYSVEIQMSLSSRLTVFLSWRVFWFFKLFKTTMHTNIGKDLKTKVILAYHKPSNSFSKAVSKHSCWSDFA